MKKLSLLRFCLCVVLLSGIWIARTQQPVHGDLKLNKIRENLYEISPVPEVSGAGGNVTVVVTRDGVILVDDKYDWDHDGILAKVKTVTDKPVRYVINTHQHGDHTGGNAKMLPMGVQLMISKQARLNMVQLKMPGLPQISFENNLQVSLGDDNCRSVSLRASAYQWRFRGPISSTARVIDWRYVRARGRVSPAHRLLVGRQHHGVDQDSG